MEEVNKKEDTSFFKSIGNSFNSILSKLGQKNLIEDFDGASSDTVLKKLDELAEHYKHNQTSVTPKFEIPAGVYINAHILVSAGPRKEKENDTELGEDATGLFNSPSGTFFWIMDGTSDSPKITSGKEHAFSSRILAQLVSANIQEIVSNKDTESIDLIEILTQAANNSKEQMQSKLLASPALIEQIKSKIADDRNPYCSTTVLLGFFSKLGQLDYFYLGDSGVRSFSYDDKNNQTFVESIKDENKNPSRLFCYIDLAEKNSIQLQFNAYEKKIKAFKKEHIDLVVAFSDGVKEELLNNSKYLSKISLIDQNTYDDKTLLVLERKTFKE